MLIRVVLSLPLEQRENWCRHYQSTQELIGWYGEFHKIEFHFDSDLIHICDFGFATLKLSLMFFSDYWHACLAISFTRIDLSPQRILGIFVPMSLEERFDDANLKWA